MREEEYFLKKDIFGITNKGDLPGPVGLVQVRKEEPVNKKCVSCSTEALVTVMVTGAGLMGFAPDGTPAKYLGGAIFLGTMLYPVGEAVFEGISSKVNRKKK